MIARFLMNGPWTLIPRILKKGIRRGSKFAVARLLLVWTRISTRAYREYCICRQKHAVRRGERLRVIIVERSASTTSLQPPDFSFRFNFLSRKPLLQSQRNQRTTPTSTTTKRQNPFASDCLNSPRKQEVTRSNTNLNTGSKSSSPTALGPLLQSSIFRELVQKNSNFSEDDSTDGEEPKNQPQVGSDDEYSGIFYEGTGDNPFVCSSTTAVDDAFATQPASEAFSPPSIYAESNGQGFDGGFGGSDDPILPAPSEMLPEEGFALREWRSQDFVMYVGGPVWALDWCPRVHQSSDGHPKCENTYESIESETLAELNEGKVLRKLPSVISIGPLAPCFFETSQQLQWLNDQATGSVLYVSFGSRTAMSREQIRELGDGLVRSGCRFLWAVKDKKVDIEDDEKLTEVLGEELLERVKKNGLAVKNWLNQEEILSHPVIGGFLSHCGWNSLSETLWNGVCVLAWPQHGNQKVNADLVERIGLRTWDKSWGWGDGEMLVKAEDIAQRVSEIMGNDLLKLHALHIRDNARRAVGDGGSSTESHCSHQHMEEVSGSTIVKPSFPRSD